MPTQNNEMLNESTTPCHILTEEQMSEQRQRAREDFERYQRTLIRDCIITLENHIEYTEKLFSTQKRYFNNAKEYYETLQKYSDLQKDNINNLKIHFNNLEEYIAHVEDPEIVIIPSLKERIENVKNRIKTLTENATFYQMDSESTHIGNVHC